MKHDHKVLLDFLAKILRTNPGITEHEFNAIPGKPCTERTYRTIWGTFRQAKILAGAPRTIASLPSDTKLFDIEKETEKQVVVNLRKEIKALQRDKLTTEGIRKYIFELKNTPVRLPNWISKVDPDKKSTHGVPVLCLSDFHFGEVVKPEQILGVNEFNLAIGEKRIQILARNTLDILKNHWHSNYPGLVICLAGDFVTGTIHEELLTTNEQPIMPIVIKVYENLIRFIKQMSVEFKNVAVFCVHGNHSRTFKKPIYKESALSSYDWLIYTMLDKYFQNNKNVNFVVSPGDDLQFKVYNHTFRLSHGSQFRGGGGFIGSLSPITRGEIKKRSTAETLKRNYDTLIIGHFHQYMILNRVIVNGSLIGYNEFAAGNNFPLERPQQALFLTHPVHGITFNCPVFCTDEKVKGKHSWVSWPKEKK